MIKSSATMLDLREHESLPDANETNKVQPTIAVSCDVDDREYDLDNNYDIESESNINTQRTQSAFQFRDLSLMDEPANGWDAKKDWNHTMDLTLISLMVAKARQVRLAHYNQQFFQHVKPKVGSPPQPERIKLNFE